MEILANSSVEVDLIKSSAVSVSNDGYKSHNSVSQSNSSPEDRVDLDMKGIYKSLTVFADEVLKKLDELLKNDLPDGVRSLKPEDHTPEKTADRIVSGVLNLFDVYKNQNPEKEGEDLIKSFLSTVKGGIKQGHDDAMKVLGDIGALDFEGVEDGISKTMELVESKLNDWEKNKLEELNASKNEAAPPKEEVKQEASSNANSA